MAIADHVQLFGRLDFYPFGYFSEGNHWQVCDIKREKELKLVFGIASSYNDGASNNVGEGHGDFFLYNVNGDIQLPDYRQLYIDLLLKFRGFSFLGEYASATASSLEQIYLDPIAFSLLPSFTGSIIPTLLFLCPIFKPPNL